jgi:subtilisin family serine protease
MKKFLFIVAAAILMLIGSCKKVDDQMPANQIPTDTEFTDGEIVPGQYVVLLKDGVTSVKSSKFSYKDAQEYMRSEMQKILAVSGIGEKEPLHVYTAGAEGFAVKLSDNESASLKNNPLVLGVWPDKLIMLKRPSTKPSPSPEGQVTPPGITKVGGGVTYTGNNKVWIVDTGIDLDHPDLNVDAADGMTFVKRTTTPDDDNGHGTHCAGIIAAKDNDIEVVGVAAGATVVPVKVLDRRGSGYMSDIIKGIDYVLSKEGTAGDAVNMSFGGGTYEPLDIEVEKLGDKGLFVAIAAGNSADDASKYSPANAEGTNIYTVSACDNNLNWAYFSNYGSPVDYCAPGVNILSLYKGGGTATMSGTSMAAPHMCGVLLVTNGHPHSGGYVVDPNGNSVAFVHE